MKKRKCYKEGYIHGSLEFHTSAHNCFSQGILLFKLSAINGAYINWYNAPVKSVCNNDLYNLFQINTLTFNETIKIFKIITFLVIFLALVEDAYNLYEEMEGSPLECI